MPGRGTSHKGTAVYGNRAREALPEDARRRLRSLVSTHGWRKATVLLGSGELTIQHAIEGGFLKAQTIARLEVAIDAAERWGSTEDEAWPGRPGPGGP